MKKTILCVLLAAVLAGKKRTFSFHLTFCTAMGTFVEDPVQTVSPEVIVDLQSLLLLPFKMIKVKSSIHSIAEFLDALGSYILLAEQQVRPYFRIGILSDLQLII